MLIPYIKEKQERLFYAINTAIRTNNVSVVNKFLDLGIKPDEKMPIFGSPIEIAIKGNYRISLSRLIDLCKHPTSVDQYLATLVKNNDSENLITLIKHGANVDALGELNQTPLQAAVSEGNKDMATILLQNGADVNCGRKTPLMIATLSNDIEMVRLLLDKGADINKESQISGFGSRTTPMKKAEKDKKDEIIELFNSYIK